MSTTTIPTDQQSTHLAEQQLAMFGDRVRAIRDSLHKVVVGQEAVIDQLLACALTGSAPDWKIARRSEPMAPTIVGTHGASVPRARDSLLDMD